MNRSLTKMTLAVLAAVLVRTAAASAPMSPIAMAQSPKADRVWIACATGCKVLEMDTAKGTVRGLATVPASPAALAAAPDGSTIYVAGGVGTGFVWTVRPDDGAIARTLAAGHSPSALAVSPDGATLYVCDRFANRVLVLSATDGAERARIPMPREPIACALTPDGRRLAVVNHLPVMAATSDTVAIDVAIVNTESGRVVGTVRLPNGCTAGRGVAISPDGRFAYVTSILGRFTLPTTQLDRGWMMTSALSVIDVAGAALVNTVLLDEIDRGAANPWGVACAPGGQWLVVAHSGTHEVSVIDRAKLHDRLERVAKGETVTPVSTSPRQVPNDLAFLVDLRERIRLPGNSHRAIVVAGDTAWAAAYFTDEVAAIDLSASPRRPRSVPLGPPTPLAAMPIARRGEIFFHDAALCFQEWQSCASCHPDGRADGLNWDLLNDGMGNPKQTKSMLYAHRTPPAMLSGVRDTAEVAVRSGIRFIQFAVRPDEDAQAIDEYLKTLTPVPSPHLQNGQMSESARRGEGVYKKAGCAECHPPPLFTNLKAYDVGTGVNQDAGKPLDTPTLCELWRTAPYLDDGRAATVRDVLKTFNAADQHGSTSKLSEQELADLEAYLLSL